MTNSLLFPILAIATVMGLAAAAFVAGAMLWLKRLRAHLAASVGDALTRQVRHGEKVEQTLETLQRHNRQLEAQVQALVQANARTRADMVQIATRLEQQRNSPNDAATPQTRILH